MGPVDVRTALGWWPEQQNVYTPIGWKHHLFRFNVFFDGTILAEPHPTVFFPKEHTRRYEGLGLQLSVVPSLDGKDPRPVHTEPHRMETLTGNRSGHQGWDKEHAAPVLWTQWRQSLPAMNGLVFESRFFAHIPGGEEVETGTEPLFGWLRLSIKEVSGLVSHETAGFVLALNAPHTRLHLFTTENCVLEPSRAAYPRALRVAVGAGSTPLIVEEGSQGEAVRLAVGSGGAEGVAWSVPQDSASGRDYTLYLAMPAEEGAHVDVLIPHIPLSMEAVEAELKQGYEAALAESDRYWSRRPGTAASVCVPEAFFNEALNTTLNSAQVVAERHPETGEYAMLTGPIVYACVWATPNAMTFSMLLDPMGRHDVVERYLEVYKAHQGEVVPPGPSYGPSPGYFGVPRSLKSVDWLSDHGAVLYTICRHALITGDQRFIDDYLDSIVAACDFIHEARARTDHGGIVGLMPPAHATDRAVPEQAVWNDGWTYKGLSAAVRLLERLGHPRAEEYAREARDYRAAFRSAYRARLEQMPLWHDSQGTPHHIPPASMADSGAESHAFHLDTGPLFLVFAGLMEAEDPEMREALAFFREGPNQRTFDPQGHFMQPAVLTHELSSCEPCYSWNIYHSLNEGHQDRFLEGFYSVLVGGLSTKTYVGCETRGGVKGLSCPFALAFDLGLRSVIDDQLEPDTLRLLRLVPPAWIAPGKSMTFEAVATEFGPVNLHVAREESTVLDVSFEGAGRIAPKRVCLHVPRLDALKTLRLNGRQVPGKPGRRMELLPVGDGKWALKRGFRGTDGG